MSRFALVLSVAVFVFYSFSGGFVAQGQRPEALTQPNQRIKTIVSPPAKQTLRVQRNREGMAFKDMHVFFRQTGNRTVLYTVGDNRLFTCLENLALERILTATQEKPERQFWKIEGEFTEFRGENFILIRRAVVAQPPATAVPAIP